MPPSRTDKSNAHPSAAATAPRRRPRQPPSDTAADAQAAIPPDTGIDAAGDAENTTFSADTADAMHMVKQEPEDEWKGPLFLFYETSRLRGGIKKAIRGWEECEKDWVKCAKGWDKCEKALDSTTADYVAVSKGLLITEKRLEEARARHRELVGSSIACQKDLLKVSTSNLELREEMKNLKALFHCLLCDGRITEAYQADRCGHSFCRACLDAYHHIHDGCPSCKSIPLAGAGWPAPNVAVDLLIRQMTEIEEKSRQARA
ncbi:hypothetical protein BD626DRAFT_573654 [Schizophyllum amplum]|uniref:RING-type domain-containing protein n=1 Tax=Schizophyllum amplum TaxID=97359 RepID=A0A550C0Y5_9AGAR|nr:hypothetical protein BD626DRAFT_573654 [Auriculariopsis ampla]